METMTKLRGQIERITFANEENGFTIARVKVYGRPDLVTVVGNLASPAPGEILEMKGEWTDHPKYGEQFRVAFYKSAVPATVYGIRKYLGSGLIPGIGPVIAERIAKKFGEDALDVIEDDIGKLAQVEGIGEKRVDMIKKAWDDQKDIRQVMLFLQTHGVSSGYATKIFKQYGTDAIDIVKENPYRLAMDIFGVGFVTADRIAEKLGFDRKSKFRAEAGLIYVLQQMSNEGHVYYPYETLIEKGGKLLEVDRGIILDGIAGLAEDHRVVIEDLNEDLDEYLENNKAVYLAKYHLCETRIASRLKMLLYASKSFRDIDADNALEWTRKQIPETLSENQERAVRLVLENKMTVITGGPGTGKTTIINAIIRIHEMLGIKIMLAAPTGRAAKRMAETCGLPAKTIHRLLEYSIADGGFKKNDESPLKCNLLIVDEASMIDTILMHHLLKAVPKTAAFVLVGDVNQLPSVGAGSVLADIIASDTVPVARLTEIFRQAKESRIIVNAHRINRGDMPQFEADTPGNDFYFIPKEDPEAALDVIIRLVSERIPKRFGYDPIDDIQVLSPMHKGTAGAGNLNTRLQEILNPRGESITRGDRTFRVGDKVMQIRNNYEKEVFNGDIGRVAAIRPEARDVIVSFDGREVLYEYPDLDEIVLAYAISIHKSQGSEYPVVVIPILTQHYILLQRNLVYTAVTRGKKLVVVVGSKKAIAIGVKNDKTAKRHTLLNERLRA